MARQTYPLNAVEVTIPTGATGISAAVDLTGLIVIRAIMPATWVAANLTFTGAESEAGTYTPLYDAAGGEYTVVASTSRRIGIPPSDALGGCWLKVRSGTLATPVDQTASRVITLLCRGFA